jgi:HAD superfamily hydrolase (TIGR01509 family)
MVKLILFDLDGVLIKAKDIHYDALNNALPDRYKISEEDHLGRYDGLTTRDKLKLLTEETGLPESSYDEIWKEKQKETLRLFKTINHNEKLEELFIKLKDEGYIVGCCSNSIRRSVLTGLSRIGVIEYCDLILANDDVANSKPHPEIYWKAMAVLKCLPNETLIIEDSPAGLLAGQRSGAEVLRVSDPDDVTYQNIKSKLSGNTTPTKWENKKLNVLIPMAGAGSRFQKAGYTFPKPLIEVNGKPMIQVVVENLALDANYIYVVQKEHREKYNLDTVLNLLTPNCTIIDVDGITEGAACTALLAKEYIDNDEPLFFANSDQFVEWNSSEFMYKMQETQADGGIPIFKSTHPKWSYVKTDNNGYVTDLAEKNPISDNATIGFYFWKQGKKFVKYAEEMIEKDLRVNNEFYVAPVYNGAIEDKLKIKTFEVERMWGLGTPEDLNYFLQEYNENG